MHACMVKIACETRNLLSMALVMYRIQHLFRHQTKCTLQVMYGKVLKKNSGSKDVKKGVKQVADIQRSALLHRCLTLTLD